MPTPSPKPAPHPDPRPAAHTCCPPPPLKQTHARRWRRFTAWLPALLAVLIVGLGAGSARAGDATGTDTKAAAGTLRLCVDAQGRREYRDTDCNAYQRQLRSVSFERIAQDPALLARSREIEREMDRRNTATFGRSTRAATQRAPARVARSTRPPPDRCQAAKERRERERENADSGLSFDQIGKLEREVWRRCKNG